MKFMVKISVITVLLGIFAFPVYSAKPKKGTSITEGLELFSVTEETINTLNGFDLFDRDEYLKAHLNTRIETTAQIESVIEKIQFRRKYLITAVSGSEQKVKLIYYIHTDDADKKTLPAGERFGFKGQLIMFTPVNTKRSVYIINVILEDGAIVVE